MNGNESVVGKIDSVNFLRVLQTQWGPKNKYQVMISGQEYFAIGDWVRSLAGQQGEWKWRFNNWVDRNGGQHQDRNLIAPPREPAVRISSPYRGASTGYNQPVSKFDDVMKELSAIKYYCQKIHGIVSDLVPAEELPHSPEAEDLTPDDL